ncbi:unnamed protein product [Didymodactylos carnosus]|uniref:Uncharacterized protein n=1 Tax=Didymodactylos carnosus TaxID=1234261 RepID=A0A8S2IPR1_9BILA|nr:unnamed protein product [Didymodactylos carnosus]CAF3757804.1 unnamed protein product [Didymodactylos carnosus]
MFGLRLHCTAHGLNLTVQNSLALWPKKKSVQQQKSAMVTISSSDLSVSDQSDGGSSEADSIIVNPDSAQEMGLEEEGGVADGSDDEEQEVSYSLTLYS